jgi:penicillin-insensitive murein endopeptidase
MLGIDSIPWGRLRGAVAIAVMVVGCSVVPAEESLPASGLDARPARDLFGAVAGPSHGPSRPIGFFAKGCLAGAVELPIDGDHWQVMRLSRNRNWGTPQLVAMIERLSHQAAAVGWPGLLVGDMSQPRGGPMKNGHASHQIGLDVDIWLTPMPARTLSRVERETMGARSMVASSRLTVDRSAWTPSRLAVIKAAAMQPDVTRIFVNAAIKKELCQEAGADRAWLHKVRPYWGHEEHFHVRMACPAGASSCDEQEPVPPGDGCSEKDLAYWFTPGVLHPKPSKPRPPLTLAQLPAACKAVLLAK